MSQLAALLGRGILALLAAAVLQCPSWAQSTGLSDAAGLRSDYTALKPLLADNAFRGPLHLASVETDHSLQGDVHAVVEYPFAQVSAALGRPEHWCDVVSLHQNTKYCRQTLADGAPRIDLRVGKKHDQPLEAASLVTFAFRTVSAASDYMAVELKSPDGPFDTSDYRIVLEATPLPGDRTFLHMGYSFSYGAIGRAAMRVYLRTIGRNKVGFTLASRPGEPPEYIGGLRGLVERNTMRYYLAIEAYLSALSTPPAGQLEKRLSAWYDATEKYPRQLHEISREEYLAMKRDEYRRQQQR
jgi:hypothetical protein